MKGIFIAQDDLRVFGGFFQFVKQQNIVRFEDYGIVLQGEFNPWIFRIFIEDANAVSNLYESKFACLTLPPSIQKIDVPAICFAKKIVVSEGAKEIAGSSLNCKSIEEIVLPESLEKISPSAICKTAKIFGNAKSAQQALQNRFISPFEKNPSIQEYLLKQKNIFDAEKYWELWLPAALKKLRAFGKDANPPVWIKNQNDFCAWLCGMDFFAGRIANIEGEPDFAFVIDESDNVDDALKYAFVSFYPPWGPSITGEKDDACISFSYPPLCCKLLINLSDFEHFADLLKIFFDGFEEHIEFFKNEEEECENKIVYADGIFRTQAAALEVYKKKIVELFQKQKKDATITDGENYFKLALGYQEAETYFVTAENAEKIYKYFGGK